MLALASALSGTIQSSAWADVVTDWNLIMQQTVSVAPTNAMEQSRWGAIMQLAVFEAVNSITKDYEPYLGTIVAPVGASPEAAAIAAAHDTLLALRPGSAATLLAARTASLAAIPDSPAKAAGITHGENVAAAMILLRVDDGAAESQGTPYVWGTDPGDWQPVNGTTPPPLHPGWGFVTPFGILTGDQFRLPAPPALHTGKYANDYSEVKLLGSLNSPFRPQDRTDVARFYAAASPVQTWNPVARQACLAQGRTLSENARLFALLNMAMADGAIASFETKYHYGFWRPMAAIRGGGTDGNHLTVGDATWVPLIATPPFPSYASGHATLSNAAREVLDRSLGKDGHDVTLTNVTLGVTLNYSAWEDITTDIDDARIYGGIHFRFDQEAGGKQGSRVGKYILENYLRPVDEFGEVIEGD
jgi:hypothetical protein